MINFRKPFNILSKKYFSDSVQINKKIFLDLGYQENSFDLILGNIPMGLRTSSSVQEPFPKKNRENWEIIFKLSQNLTDNSLILLYCIIPD